MDSSAANPRLCTVDGCTNPMHSKGLCSTHAARMRRWGDVRADLPIGFNREIVHGTYDGYNNHGCRCDECRQAHTDHTREARWYRKRHRPLAIAKAERRAAAEARDNHGTETRYKLGCRCDVCRRGARDAKRRRRARAAQAVAS